MSDVGHARQASIFREVLTEFGLLLFVGLIVAIAIIPLLHVELLRDLDRGVLDIMMRQNARHALINPKQNSPRFVYVDITEEACEIWAKSEGSWCALGWSPGREHLTQIVNTITRRLNESASKFNDQSYLPRLILIDVNLVPRGKTNSVRICSMSINSGSGQVCARGDNQSNVVWTRLMRFEFANTHLSFDVLLLTRTYAAGNSEVLNGLWTTFGWGHP